MGNLGLQPCPALSFFEPILPMGIIGEVPLTHTVVPTRLVSQGRSRYFAMRGSGADRPMGANAVRDLYEIASHPSLSVSSMSRRIAALGMTLLAWIIIPEEPELKPVVASQQPVTS